MKQNNSTSRGGRMGRKHFILLACLLIVMLVVLAWKPFHLGEPLYHGKSLSVWL